MRRSVAVPVVVFLFAALGCSGRPSTAKAEAEIARSRDAFWAAHERGDAVAMAAYLTEDAVLMAPGSPSVRGRTAIQAAATQMFTSLRITDFKILSSEVSVLDSTAYELTSYTETLRPTAGLPSPVEGRYLIVWLRGPDGQWRLHRNLFNMAGGAHP